MKLYEVHAEIRQAQPTAVCRSTLMLVDIGPWLGKVYGSVAGLLSAQQAGPAGPPFARYHLLSDGRFEVEAGFPASRPVESSGDVQPSELPGGPVAVTVHTGSYDAMEPGYRALASWVTDNGGEATEDAWEVYFSDPTTQPDPATWRTEIVQPYRHA